MKFDIIYDDHGKPVHVCTDDSFMQSSRAFDPEEDGWMLDQLDERRFPVIQAGRQMEALVAEVNFLHRENFRLKKSESQWMKVGLARGL